MMSTLQVYRRYLGKAWVTSGAAREFRMNKHAFMGRSRYVPEGPQSGIPVLLRYIARQRQIRNAKQIEQLTPSYAFVPRPRNAGASQWDA